MTAISPEPDRHCVIAHLDAANEHCCCSMTLQAGSNSAILMKKRIFHLSLIWTFAATAFVHNAAFAQAEPSHEVVAPSTKIFKGENKVTTTSALTPAKDATEVLQRLLALIDSLHRPQDLTLDQVAKFTGLLIPKADWPSKNDAHMISQDLTEAWLYRYIWVLNNTTRLPGLGLAFTEADKYSNQDIPMIGVCQFDVAQFHDALLRLGYEHVSSVRQESKARQYQRGAVEVEVGIVGESGESLEKISHDCIKRVSIGFLTRYLNRGGQQ